MKIEKQILMISFIAGLILAITELILALITHSQSVLMDGVYDTIELVLIIGTLFLTPLFYGNITEKRPFGYGQIESFYVILKGFMMISVTLGLILNSFQLIFNGGNHVESNIIIISEIAYGIIDYLILVVLNKLNKKISSPTVDLEIKGWQIDVYYSLGIALAFSISTLLVNTPLSPIIPYIDQIIAIIVVLFMLPNMFKTVIEAINDLLLFAPKKDIFDNIAKKSKKTMEKYPFDITFHDITKVGRKYFISIYFKPKHEIISTKSLKQATEEIKELLKNDYDDFYVELIVEV